MSAQFERLRQEILALSSLALMQSALRMTGDDTEAATLVEQTLIEAFAIGETRGAEAGDTGIWMFGLLRSTFHSIARRRSVRQERGPSRRAAPARPRRGAGGRGVKRYTGTQRSGPTPVRDPRSTGAGGARAVPLDPRSVRG